MRWASEKCMVHVFKLSSGLVLLDYHCTDGDFDRIFMKGSRYLRECLVDEVKITLTSHFPAVDTEIAPAAPLLKFGLQNALYPCAFGGVWGEANLRDCLTICITLWRRSG